MKKDTFHLATVVVLCLLIHPIVNQFFDDKLFSIMSHWVQRIFFIFIVVKYGIVIKNKDLKDASNI